MSICGTSAQLGMFREARKGKRDPVADYGPECRGCKFDPRVSDGSGQKRMRLPERHSSRKENCSKLLPETYEGDLGRTFISRQTEATKRVKLRVLSRLSNLE